MFPFPQNTQWGSPQTAPAAGSRSHALYGYRTPPPAPRVSKSHSLRLALSERMCDIEVQPAVPFCAPTPDFQPIYALQGGVIAPPASRLFPRWDTMRYGDSLLMIQAFAKACVATSTADTSAFSHSARGWKANRLGRLFLEVVPVIEAWSRSRHVDTRLDPQMQLAVDVFREVGFLEGTGMGPVGQVECWFAQDFATASVAVRVNAFIDELRKRGGQVGAGRKMQRHDDMHAAQGRELRSYFKGVLKRHSGCSVLRFELCMGRNSKLSPQEEYDFMLEASARYLRELKEVFGEALVADVRKMDRGNTSNYLVHVLLALDGPNAHEMSAIRQTVVHHWGTQTLGVGYLVDCHAVENFMYRGYGSPFGQHESNASRLDKAAVFLADTDRIMHVGYGRVGDGLLIGRP